VWLVSGGGPVPEGVYGVRARFADKGIQDVPITVPIVRGTETVVDCRSGFCTCTMR